APVVGLAVTVSVTPLSLADARDGPIANAELKRARTATTLSAVRRVWLRRFARAARRLRTPPVPVDLIPRSPCVGVAARKSKRPLTQRGRPVSPLARPVPGDRYVHWGSSLPTHRQPLAPAPDGRPRQYASFDHAPSTDDHFQALSVTSVTAVRARRGG